MNKSDNNTKINENEMWNGIGFSGPHTVFHHQFFQMVDLMIAHVRRSISILNSHTLSCEPHQKQKEIKQLNEKPKEHTTTTLSKATLHKERNQKQGWKKKRNRKKHKNAKPKVAEDYIDANRFSRLQNMVGDMTEVTQLLCKAAEKQNTNNEKKKKC